MKIVHAAGQIRPTMASYRRKSEPSGISQGMEALLCDPAERF